MHIINQELIDKVINEIDIVDVIEKDIDMVKKGANFVGLCPFHDDNNPSFTVSPEKKIYKCFVCNEGGNVITYLQKKQHLSFRETIAFLAKSIGIEIKLDNEVTNTELHNVYNDTMLYYKTILHASEQAMSAIKYLQSRKISDKAIEYFNLGYAIKDNKLGEYLTKKSNENQMYSLYDIDNSSLINNQYEFFNERLMIPVLDEFNRVVAFSGRTLKDETPKYINSRETKIFNKRRILYNFNNAKKYLAESELIIVEGFFDVISLYEANINNVIALMGTNFSNDHISLLNKYKIKKFKLLLDSDDAGITSTLKIGTELYKNKMLNVQVLKIKEEKDIDEYLTTGKKFNDLEELDFMEFKIHALLKKYNIDDINEQLKYLEDIKLDLKYLEDNKRLLIINLLEKKLEIDKNTLIQMLDIKNTRYSKEKKKIAEPSQTIDIKQEYTFENIQKSKGEKEASGSIKVQRINLKLLLSDEGVFIAFCLLSKENLLTIKSEYKNGNIRFNSLKKLYTELIEYYETNDEFDILKFLDMFGNDETFTFLNKMNEMTLHGKYNFERLPILYTSTKKVPAGFSMYKKRRPPN